MPRTFQFPRDGVQVWTPVDIVAHRVLWSLPFLGALITVSRGWPRVRAAIGDRRTLGTLTITALLIGGKDTTALGKNLAPPAVRATLGNYPVLGKAAAALPNPLSARGIRGAIFPGG